LETEPFAIGGDEGGEVGSGYSDAVAEFERHVSRVWCAVL
jgi:hypothetical protein